MCTNKDAESPIHDVSRGDFINAIICRFILSSLVRVEARVIVRP